MRWAKEKREGVGFCGGWNGLSSLLLTNKDHKTTKGPPQRVKTKKSDLTFDLKEEFVDQDSRVRGGPWESAACFPPLSVCEKGCRQGWRIVQLGRGLRCGCRGERKRL